MLDWCVLGSLVTVCRYICIVTRSTSVHNLGKRVSLAGVCRRVCTGGVHGLLSGKMGAAWPQAGPSTQFPRHQ